jgi:tRNA pseudouridine55 synthase
MVSAVSVGGKRLYDLARQGIEVERQARQIVVTSIELLDVDAKARTALLDVCCSKGTYIRTLADDIGAALGIGASLSALRRTEACGFSLDDCTSLDWMQEHAKDQSWQSALRPVHSVFSSFLHLDVGKWQAGMLQNGVALSLAKLNNPPPGRYSVWCEGEFLGLGMVDALEEGMRLKKF